MSDHHLAGAVMDFASLTASLPDARLETPWKWQDYDEGVRFAFFRIYEGLRTLAASLATLRAAQGMPRSTAQSTLGQVQVAYRELQAILLTLPDEEGKLEPAPGEWPVWGAMDHIIDAERNFFAVISFALQRARGLLPHDLPLDEAWVNAFWAAANDTYEQEYASLSLSGLKAYYASLHDRIVESFEDISDEELSIPSEYWESTWMPVEFRLHRIDAHLRQHTIQIEKTLAMLGKPPGEAQRLLRLVFSALGEVEGVLIGDPGLGMGSRESLSGDIARITAEVQHALAGAGSADAPGSTAQG